MIREIKGSKKGILTRAINQNDRNFIIKELSYKAVSRAKYSEILDHHSYLDVIDFSGKGVEGIDYVFIEDKKSGKKYVWIGTDRGTVAYSIGG